MAPVTRKRYIVERTVERRADRSIGDDGGLSIRTTVHHAICPALVIFADCTSTGVSHIRHRTEVRRGLARSKIHAGPYKTKAVGCVSLLVLQGYICVISPAEDG